VADALRILGVEWGQMQSGLDAVCRLVGQINDPASAKWQRDVGRFGARCRALRLPPFIERAEKVRVAQAHTLALEPPIAAQQQ
jgi:hypothetical protein